MPRKPALTAEQAEQVRDLAAEGWSTRALGERFGISHTAIAGYLRTRVTPASPVEPTARVAINAFVAGLGELHGEQRALAALATTLADRIDATRPAGSAAVATRTLADLVERLAEGVRKEQSEEQAHRALRAIGLAA
jgi:hypothetical protein